MSQKFCDNSYFAYISA
ncbi:unnamed protein product, partial [Adineta steineri]